MAQLQTNSTLLDTQSLSSLTLARVAIVHTEWNDKIVNELVTGCMYVLHEFNATLTHKIAVPGSFELPFGCRKLWQHSEHTVEIPEAIIAFGAVIRGGTPHFDYVCRAVTDGILQLNLTLPIPVIFGVLTLDTEDQAWERLGGEHGHKGKEAAISALKMIKIGRGI